MLQSTSQDPCPVSSHLFCSLTGHLDEIGICIYFNHVYSFILCPFINDLKIHKYIQKDKDENSKPQVNLSISDTGNKIVYFKLYLLTHFFITSWSSRFLRFFLVVIDFVSNIERPPSQGVGVGFYFPSPTSRDSWTLEPCIQDVSTLDLKSLSDDEPTKVTEVPTSPSRPSWTFDLGRSELWSRKTVLLLDTPVPDTTVL